MFGNRLGTRPCPFRESFLHILDNMGVKIKRKLQNNSGVSCYFIIFTYHSWDRIQVSVLRRLFWLGSFLFLVRNSEAWGLQKECLGVYSQKIFGREFIRNPRETAICHGIRIVSIFRLAFALKHLCLGASFQNLEKEILTRRTSHTIEAEWWHYLQYLLMSSKISFYLRNVHQSQDY